MTYQRFLLRVAGMALGTAAILVVVGEFDWRGPAALFYGLFMFFAAIDTFRLFRFQKSQHST